MSTTQRFEYFLLRYRTFPNGQLMYFFRKNLLQKRRIDESPKNLDPGFKLLDVLSIRLC